MAYDRPLPGRLRRAGCHAREKRSLPGPRRYDVNRTLWIAKSWSLSRRWAKRLPGRLQFIVPAHNSRLLAVPLIGYLIRHLLLIPHLLLLMLLSFVIALTQLFLWLPVLIGGKYPKWGYGLVGGFLRWNTRVAAYSLGLTDAYPPFRLGS